MANEITNNKSGVISGLLAGVIVVGSVAGYVFTGKDSAAQSTSAPPPGGVPPASAPGRPGSAAAPPAGNKPGRPSSPPKGKAAAPAPPKVLTNSWEQAGEATSTSTPTTPAAPGAPAASGSPAAPTAADSSSKPAPIAQGQQAVGYRPDPFVSFTRRLVEEIPAYQLIAHIRLASRPRPTPPPLPSDPYTRFGPLPQVERRVAGILFDGSVSAILETGTPGGSSTRVSVIQPGSLVPSGVPGLRDLTVASITKNEVILRADDGRTTTVKLSSVPAAYAEAFRGAASGGDNAAPGGPAQGPGGPTPGSAGPGRGGRGGGGRPSAPPRGGI